MDNYHKRPEWSYSSMKKIIDSGIDYAVAAKNGLLPPPSSAFIDLGQLAHMLVLGGDDTFAISPYADFRTKEAREWRDAQIAAGKNIITDSQFKAVESMVKNIEDHPLTPQLLLGEGWKHEVEMYANTTEGVALRGKADALKVTPGESLITTDIKTTAKFDDFKKKALWNHYDLQAANYNLIGASSQGIDPGMCNFYFCVVETVVPYRVQYFHCSPEFLESGERKLRTCIDAIVAFGNKEPSFLITEVGELGDWSL